MDCLFSRFLQIIQFNFTRMLLEATKQHYLDMTSPLKNIWPSVMEFFFSLKGLVITLSHRIYAALSRHV